MRVCVWRRIRTTYIFVFVVSHTYAIRIDNDYLLSDTKMNEFLICVIGLFSRICHFLMIQVHKHTHARWVKPTNTHIAKQKHELVPLPYAILQMLSSTFSHFRPFGSAHALAFSTYSSCVFKMSCIRLCYQLNMLVTAAAAPASAVKHIQVYAAHTTGWIRVIFWRQTHFI